MYTIASLIAGKLCIIHFHIIYSIRITGQIVLSVINIEEGVHRLIDNENDLVDLHLLGCDNVQCLSFWFFKVVC